MASPRIRWLPSRLHYAWVIVAVAFAVVVVTAGVRSTPGVLIVPLEEEFHWSRATISLALGGRDRFIKTFILDHWRENGGRVPAFGGITGYVLVLIAGYGAFDFGLPFSVTGDRSGAMQTVERLGKRHWGLGAVI